MRQPAKVGAWSLANPACELETRHCLGHRTRGAVHEGDHAAGVLLPDEDAIEARHQPERRRWSGEREARDLERVQIRHLERANTLVVAAQEREQLARTIEHQDVPLSNRCGSEL